VYAYTSFGAAHTDEGMCIDVPADGWHVAVLIQSSIGSVGVELSSV
jgi:hypothetical protein